MSRAAEQPQVDHRTELLQAFRIGWDDLEANRAGLLGGRQRQRLVRSGYLNLALAAALAAGLGVVVLAVAARPYKPGQLAMAALLAGAVLVVGVVQLVKASGAATDGRVDVHAGPVHLRMRGRAGWYLSTDSGESFKLPIAFWHVAAGAPYRVYAAPRARRIVAMEPDGWA